MEYTVTVSSPELDEQGNRLRSSHAVATRAMLNVISVMKYNEVENLEANVRFELITPNTSGWFEPVLFLQ